jgi:predicted GNAT family acetyltransferase
VRILKYTGEEIFSRPEIVKRLKFLTNGGWGRHRVGSAFMDDLEYRRPGTYFLAWESGRIIAWGMMCLRYDNGRYLAEDPRQIYQFGCYVGAKFRRLGIASKLATRALAYSKETNVKLIACPWDHKSSMLYQFLSMDTAPYWS